MYSLIKKQNIKNIGEGYIYNHKKTGAKIFYIKNDDENKVFSIAFRTMPKNNTGMEHILEHCVLAGSKKYPLKEPFNQLSKCTLNTYLNAMTFADKTLYPIASKNDKDFFKLMDVYLDGVFFPLIYEKKGIFLQEGWHFNGESINGIVFNEMQGSFSSPEAILDYNVKKNLFKNGYNFDSGGFPKEIPNLTYEEFLNFHKNYYTPSNSIIYFYGDLDIDYYLDYIHNEYLNKFEKAETHKINKCTHVPTNNFLKEHYYYEKEDFEEENYLQASFKLNFSLEPEKSLAFSIISSILTRNSESILKKAFLKEGISNVYSYVEDDLIEPVFSIIIEGTSFNDLSKFKNIIEDTIKNIDLTEEDIEGYFAPTEFALKEKDFGNKPKGLFYNMRLLKSAIYEKYDFDYLDFDNITEKAKKLDFKKLLEQYILNNKNCIYSILEPSSKKEEINTNLKKDIEDLILYQNEKDTKENLAKIPPIDLKDIKNEIFKINSKPETINNIPIIFNKIDSEIFYINLVFDIKDFQNNPYVTLFAYLFDKLGTVTTPSEDIQKSIERTFGGYSVYNSFYSTYDGSYLPAFKLLAKMLNNNLNKGILLINELFKDIDFSQKEKIKALIEELINTLDLYSKKGGSGIVVKRAKAILHEKFYYLENVTGLTFYNWLKKEVDLNNMDEVLHNLNKIKANLYCKERLYIAVSANEDMYKKFLNLLDNFEFRNYNKFNNTISLKEDISPNEAFICNAFINYNALVCNLKEHGFNFTGYLNILNTILDRDYIWEKIRTEGGAYGGGVNFSRDGVFTLYSYMDPNIKNTYESFKNIYKYIQELKLDKEELHMYKIGTINDFDTDVKNSEINELALKYYFNNVSNEDILKQKNEILTATLQNIKDYAVILEKGIKKANICTIGDEVTINNNINVFKTVYKL